MLDKLYIKTSKGSAKSTCKKLTHEHFEDLTRFRWRLITQRDVSSWDNKDGVSAHDGFSSQIFVHVRKTLENVPTGLR